MIYIKNYQALNDYADQSSNNYSSSYRSELQSMIGKPITVFVDSGGVSGRGFTGVLTEVLNDRIKLITSLPSAPNCSMNHSCNKKNRSEFGTCTTIMLEHITAVTYNFV